MMSKLLLPYAYDSNRSLVHIDNATKGKTYTCPNCDAELLLKISKIPAGKKYHKRSHFAHKGNSDNHCSESLLHQIFKEKCVEFISKKIANHEHLFFEWNCEKCEERHKGNLLKKVVRVVSEHDLGMCKPDIALFDKDGKVIIVIEVIVTHKPEPDVMQYYDENKIACLQIHVNDFADCDKIAEKLSSPNQINICSNPKCEQCGKIMHSVKMATIRTTCWRCGEDMRIAILFSQDEDSHLTTKYFNEEDIKKANLMGANIKMCYSKTDDRFYFANVCGHCNFFIDSSHLYKYFSLPHEAESEYYYKCYKCGHCRQTGQTISK